MKNYHRESLSHDAIHGYIPFVSRGSAPEEPTERDVVDHPWVQRMRQIHQLQTAWWVFPTAEHTRFQHVVGVMHLASCACEALYQTLRETCPDVPSRGYVETLLRMAGLLHDVGHGPFGHFFDEHFLRGHGLTHETLGAHIIESELGEMLRGLRRNPNTSLADDETLDPRQVAWLICRPKQPDRKNAAGEEPPPRWLHFLRSLMSGIYTIDNIDFVLRDAYMAGYSQRAFDLDRLLHYSFYSERGLTIHDKGMGALLRFMTARADLFRAIYFHRTVRGIDLTLADLFPKSIPHLFPGNPLEHLDRYRDLTEFSLLVEVNSWKRSANAELQSLGEAWQAILQRKTKWHSICQRTLIFEEGDAERSSIFSDARLVEHRLRDELAAEWRDAPLRVDIARHIYRPHTLGPADGQNFLYDSARHAVRPLKDDQLFSRLPVAHRICRVYAKTLDGNGELSQAVGRALDGLLGSAGSDDLTNM